MCQRRLGGDRQKGQWRIESFVGWRRLLYLEGISGQEGGRRDGRGAGVVRIILVKFGRQDIISSMGGDKHDHIQDQKARLYEKPSA